MEPELVANFGELFELRFEEGKLLVSKECETMPDIHSQLEAGLLGSWSINRFTESRWQTIGRCCRGLTVGLLTGLGGLCEYILGETTSSHFYVNGWRRLQGDRLAFVTTLALTPRVSDSLHLDMITDVRVARRLGGLVTNWEEEVDWLSVTMG